MKTKGCYESLRFFWLYFFCNLPVVFLRNPSVLDECDIDQKTKEALLIDIRHRLTPQASKIRADFEVSCFTFEGIDAIKQALRAGVNLSSEAFPIKVHLPFVLC